MRAAVQRADHLAAEQGIYALGDIGQTVDAACIGTVVDKFIPVLAALEAKALCRV